MSYDAPPPPQGGSPYGAPPPAAAHSNKPVWALVCGIVGLLCFGIILGPVAIILGRQAQRDGQPGGMAKAGEILRYVDFALFVLWLSIVLNRRAPPAHRRCGSRRQPAAGQVADDR